jgi:molecular chaperone GrpE
MAEEPTNGAAPSPTSVNPPDPPADAAADPQEAAGTESAEDLRRERDEYYDRLLRKTAEFDNYRRRLERERREQADQAVVRLLQELLLVVDDFDRAASVEPGADADAYRKGVGLIHAKLHDLLKKYGVKPIEALGAQFDPNLHQAVVHEESPDHQDGEVIAELQRGYMIGDRLLRPAMVKVAKA